MTVTTKSKKEIQIDLSEYVEEKIPFDAVIRKLAKSKPKQTSTPKPKSVRKHK